MANVSSEIGVYTQRAYLLGGYAAMFGGVLSHNDKATPGWPLLYIETPEGQISRHIHPGDLKVFDGMNLPVVDNYPWDGHTTEEMFRRIGRLNLRIPKMTYANPEYGQS